MAAVEFVVELLQFLQNLLHVARRVHQVCDAEVVRALLLPEARAWHGHDASLVNHLHAVDEVWLLALPLGLVDKLLTEVDLREGVHGALDLCATHLLHVVERVGEELGALFQSIEHVVVLAHVLVDAFN